MNKNADYNMPTHLSGTSGGSDDLGYEDEQPIHRDITRWRNEQNAILVKSNRERAARIEREKSAAMQALDYERRSTTEQPEPVSPAVSLVRMSMAVIVALGAVALAMKFFVAWFVG